MFLLQALHPDFPCRIACCGVVPSCDTRCKHMKNGQRWELRIVRLQMQTHRAMRRGTSEKTRCSIVHMDHMDHRGARPSSFHETCPVSKEAQTTLSMGFYRLLFCRLKTCMKCFLSLFGLSLSLSLPPSLAIASCFHQASSHTSAVSLLFVFFLPSFFFLVYFYYTCYNTTLTKKILDSHACKLQGRACSRKHVPVPQCARLSQF